MPIKEFAEKFIKAQKDAWQNGNFDALEALENPDVTYHFLALNQDMSGWEGHKQYIMGARQAMSDIRQEWKYITGEGDIFALSYKSSGKITGEIPGMSLPIGKEMHNDYIFVIQLRHGKIGEAWLNGSMTFQ